MNRKGRSRIHLLLLTYVVMALAVVGLWRWSRQVRAKRQARVAERAKREAPARPVVATVPESLSSIEQNTIRIFKKVSPSVVTVANRAMVRDLFSFQAYEVPQGTGSGFIWDKEGHVISNFHVVYRASSVSVTLRDGTTYDAEVVGVDPDHDVAVLKIDAPPEQLVPVAVGTSNNLQVGQRVLAIGNPFGLDTSLSVGIVSALGRTIESMTGRHIYEVIQTDAAINPGNSGGPLLDSSGRLIGVNTAIVSPSGAYAGIGFAVPVDTIRRAVAHLIAYGKPRRAGLGIQILPDHIARQAGIEGVAIARVFANTAAARAGLRGIRQARRGAIAFGDIIVAIDDQTVSDNDDLLSVLDRSDAGDEVTLTLRRGEETEEIAIKLQGL